MSLVAWLALNALAAPINLWVLAWGGAEKIEGWLSVFYTECHGSLTWSAEQIRLFALLILIVQIVLIAPGIFVPELRVW